MAPPKRKITSKEKNPRARHFALYNWIKVIQKARQLSTLRGVDAVLLVFLPPMPSTDFIANNNRSLHPVRRPDSNQEHRRIALRQELIELNKVLDQVRARIQFLSQQNAQNSSDQGLVSVNVGDATVSSTPTLVSDATASSIPTVAGDATASSTPIVGDATASSTPVVEDATADQC